MGYNPGTLGSGRFFLNRVVGVRGAGGLGEFRLAGPPWGGGV